MEFWAIGRGRHQRRLRSWPEEPTVVGRPPIGPVDMPSAPPSRARRRGAWGRTARPGGLGGRRPGRVEADDAAPAEAGRGRAGGTGESLVAAAAPLLMVSRLREVVEQADVEALRRKIAEQLRVYETRAARFGAQPGDVSAGRYALAAFIDEAVMTTPWGGASASNINGLLREFRSESGAAEGVRDRRPRPRPAGQVSRAAEAARAPDRRRAASAAPDT